MQKRFVMYRGIRVIEGWPERIREAQKENTYIIAGKEHRRVPYGSESQDVGADTGACHDCCVVKGELHVPGCDTEECPACGGQAITCGCLDEDAQ